ncbi:hypothetical protein RsoM2USA_416 [Ralstonia phage RsoM2USA]|nr:hypothetical protein RsoM2USA_416 [Ralstonia phage RsoM2USA]
MSNTLLLKRSAVPGKTPLLTDLQLGQLAINTYDGKLYTRKDNGTASIIDLGNITLSGDVTGSGSGSITLTLANSGVTAGTYKSVTVDAKGRVTAGTNPTTLAGYGITDGVNVSSLAAANGVATLDSFGKLLTSQIPASLVGAVVYQGVWNASTNSPTLTSGTGTKGNYYKVSVAGSTNIDGHSSWNIGDMIIFNGTTWDKIDGVESEVLSVFGRTGVVTMLSSDVTTALGYTPLSGNQNITLSGDATGSGATSITVTLADSGVTAGTYSSVTVDAKGRVTSGGQINSGTVTSALGYTPVQTVAGRTGNVVLTTSDVTGYGTVSDSVFSITNNSDPTKIAKFDASGISTGTTNTYTLPSVTGTLASLANISQTFTGTTTFSGTSVTVGSSTATATYGFGSGATVNGSTKTINIGTSGVSGSTTAITVGSTTSTTTIALNGAVTASTPTTADNSTLIATTAFVKNQGYAQSSALSASSGSSLVNFIASGSAAVSRTVQSVLRDTFNVRNYGAVGNGVTDDTAALNAMFAMIQSNATVVDVYFPAGNYIYSGSGLTGNAYVGRIRGDGPTASMITAASSAVTGSALTFTATADGLTLQDIGIFGPGQGAAGGQDGVVISNGGSPVRQPRFVNCEIYNWPGKALNVTTPIAGSAHNCRFQNNIHGVYLSGGTSFTFYNCYPNGNKKSGYWLNGTTYSTFNGCAADTNGIAYLLSGSTAITLVGCGNEAGTANNLTITNSSLTSNVATFTYSGPDQSADFIGNGRTVIIQGSTNIPAANAGISGLGDGRWPIASVGTNTISINLTSANISSAADTGTASFWAGDGVVINGSTIIQIQGYRTIAPAQTSSSMLVTEGSANQVTVTGMRSTQGSGSLQLVDMWLGNGTANIIRMNNAFTGGTYSAANNISTVSNGTWTLPTVTGVNALNSNGNLSLTTTASATSGTNNNSPTAFLIGTYWTGTASSQDVVAIQSKPATGANPLISLNFQHQSGSSGGMQLSVNGTPFLSGNSQFIGTSINTSGNATIGGTLSVTGVATAPTAAPGTNTTQIATTAFVQTATSSYLPLAGGTVTGAITLNAAPVVNGTAGWTTVSWNKGMRLSPSTAIEFAGPSSNHFGIGNSGGTLYFFTNTADDNSAAPNYFMTANSSGTVTYNAPVNGTFFNVSVSGAVAAAGTTQGTATALTSSVNVVTSGTGGVVLPAATGGMELVVINTTGSAINVYPASGGQIDSLGANVAFSLGAGAKLCYVATSTTQWYSLTAVYA